MGDSIKTYKMQVKILVILAVASFVSGMPHPNPGTMMEMKVDPRGHKMDGSALIRKMGGGTNFALETNIYGEKPMGYECCVVDGVQYENGATNVPCGYNNPKTGKCIDGQVQCMHV